MLLKLLTFLDFLGMIVLITNHFGIYYWRISLVAGLYFLIKGFIYRWDWMSVMDMTMGVYHLLVLIGFKSWLLWIFVVFTMYKVLAGFLVSR